MVAEQFRSMAAAEMAESLQRVGEQPPELSVEERNLLSVAYGSIAGNRRAVWRIVTSVEQKEKTKGNKQQALYEREYVSKVEDELRKICDGIVVLKDNNFIPLARAEESKGLDYKVKGEYARYLAKCATDDAANKACKMACVAFEDASADSDKVVDVPRVTQETPTVQTIQKTIEIPQWQGIDKVIDIPVVLVVRVPQSRVVEQTVEIPQLQLVEKMVEIPVVQTVQIQISEHLCTTPVCKVAQGEIGVVVEMGVPLPAESASHMLVEINSRSIDFASGVHVGKDDLDDGMFEYVRDETEAHSFKLETVVYDDTGTGGRGHDGNTQQPHRSKQHKHSNQQESTRQETQEKTGEREKEGEKGEVRRKRRKRKERR